MIMMCKCFHKLLYEYYYPQRPVCFLDLLANPSDQTFFLRESFYVYYILLVISLFFKVHFFPQVLQICYFTSCILWYSDFI